MGTYSIKAKDINHDWYVVDATDKTLGRLASTVAMRLRGKHKPEYTPHLDVGDFIIIINAEKIAVTGNKVRDKLYHHHSGYTGGIKTTNFAKLIKADPTKILEIAIKGMMPKGPLGREMLSKLKIYAGSEHPHAAQQPKSLTIEE
jgi:large subunit ribosomal protein L13